MTIEQLLGLPLHATAVLKTTDLEGVQVLRVHNGWIYYRLRFHGKGMYEKVGEGTFVPESLHIEGNIHQF